MNAHSPTPKNRLARIVQPSLRFWVVAPIFIMLILFLLALLGFALITRQSPPFELFLIAIASFLAVAGIALLITRRISRRFQNIIGAADRIAQGDFTIRVKDDHDDEIGQLVRAFNEMVTNLEQLHQSRDLLSRTMSPAVRESMTRDSSCWQEGQRMDQPAKRSG